MKFLNLIFIGITLIFSCSKTTYWTSGPCFIPESANTIEIQITDSTFTTFESNWNENFGDNKGNAEVRKCRFIGDTLLFMTLA